MKSSVLLYNIVYILFKITFQLTFEIKLRTNQTIHHNHGPNQDVKITTVYCLTLITHLCKCQVEIVGVQPIDLHLNTNHD